MSNLHLLIPAADVPVPRLARPLSPGCPTDSAITSNEVSMPWHDQIIKPRTAISRQPSWDESTLINVPPTHRSPWCIEPGTIVAFSLDRSAATELTPDLEARHAITNFPLGKYLGLVTASYSYYPDEGSDAATLVEEVIVNYIGALPPPVQALWHHSNLIHPLEHVATSRWPLPPLRTTTLFPFTDRFVWTALGVRLRITQVHDSRLKFVLEEEEFARFEDQAGWSYAEMAEFMQSDPAPDLLAAIAHLQVPMFTLPAQIWRDVREANQRDDPTGFWRDVWALEAICEAAEDASAGSHQDEPSVTVSLSGSDGQGPQQLPQH